MNTNSSTERNMYKSGSIFIKYSVLKMDFVKQPTSLPIKNVSVNCGEEEYKSPRHSKLLPNTIRAIICGPSNCGKTNVILSLLEGQNGLRFENVYIYSRSLYQPKYQYLEKALKPIKGVGFFKFSDNEEVIPPEKARPNSIFIFDDVICDKQNNIKLYFCMGRHRAIDCFYLCQSYTHIPKHLIRDNSNFAILFKQDDLNLKHIYNDFSVSADMTFEKFKNMTHMCWKKKYDFVVIDKDRDLNDGRYRKCFDEFIYIKK